VSKPQPEWDLDKTADPPLDADEVASAAKALPLLIDNEAKLLAAYDARQASADARITALATASVALLTLTLSLSKAFARNPARLHVVYAVVVVAAVLVGFARAWNGWRRRAVGKMTDDDLAAARSKSARTPGENGAGARTKNAWTISSEAVEVAQARRAWRAYQRETPVRVADQIRVQQLALRMWRARADDSRRIAQTKDKLSAAAAIVFAVALGLSAYLVAHADFS